MPLLSLHRTASSLTLLLLGAKQPSHLCLKLRHQTQRQVELHILGMMWCQRSHHFLLLQLAILVHVKHGESCLVERRLVLLIVSQLLVGLVCELFYLCVHLLLHFALHRRPSQSAHHRSSHRASLLSLCNAAVLEVPDIAGSVVLKKHLALILVENFVPVFVMMLESVGCVNYQSLLHFCVPRLDSTSHSQDCIEIPITHRCV
mmetsp:Transcript_9848/g.23459  ORF Transcript_9848/g.23459 Transcript_9848/m.23459 type:complete len:203 (-) Transcript_9848:134-742(-)